MQGSALFDVVLLWTGGACEVELAIGTRRLSSRRFSGSIDLVPAGTVIDHVTWRGDQAWKVVEIALPASTGQALLGSEVRLGVTDPHVVDLGCRLADQAESGMPFGETYVDGLTLALTSYLSARHGSGSPPDERAAAALSRRSQDHVRDYIAMHLAQDIRVSDLAAIEECSPRQFTRRFKASFGVSPHQYLLSCRVERAQALLRDVRLPIADIALACGFASQAHLTVAFRLRTGMSPGAYRRAS